MNETVVKLTDVSFGYDEHNLVLEHIDLEIKKGDFLALIGPNGGGKSTLLRLILGLLQPQNGTIEVFSKSPDSAREHIGYVPQNTDINPHFPVRVLEVVIMGYAAKKRPLLGYTKEEKTCARKMLASVNIETYAERKIGELSGGQRQRVMIARALCSSPSLLILDEPTANIDPKGQKEIYELLSHLNKSVTVIVVSHDLSIILEYANKVAYVNHELSFHDISDKKAVFHTHGVDSHFCEVELLEMLGSHRCDICEKEAKDG